MELAATCILPHNFAPAHIILWEHYVSINDVEVLKFYPPGGGNSTAKSVSFKAGLLVIYTNLC